MEFNIALHTIFYITIFIIPGTLLRRFYFSGEFNKEFSQGNLMERFMWTIFSSILVLLISSLFFYFIRIIYNKELLSAISYDTIKEVFDLLTNNDLPTSTQFFAIYKDFLILLFGIYFASILIGWASKKIAISRFVSSYVPVFRYKNYWYYFVRGKVKSASKGKNKEYWYTETDILIQQDGSTKMYSGKISDYYIDPNNNQLESIFLEDTKRYKYKEDGQYELVSIPGDVFCIPYNRILNINLTYVNKEKVIRIRSKVFWYINEMFYAIASLILLSTLWVEDIPDFNFSSFRYKLFFTLNSWLILGMIRNIFRKYIFPEVYKKETVRPLFLSIVFSIIQYIWIFDFYGFWLTFLISILIFIFLANIFIQTKKAIDNSK
ncbi:hypothetical protein [Maribacter aquivivus]|uniref:hypothetical protein n=1 Tax=Maribacter aquivivus TaxID=228958 RepID=UPI0024915855|nr:hypothetical protein [Maribacter aquivivus]